MFVWYAVPVQSTIIIHVSNYKTMCQVSSVHYQPRSSINELFASLLQINTVVSGCRLSVRVDASLEISSALLRQPRYAVVSEDFGLPREVGQA